MKPPALPPTLYRITFTGNELQRKEGRAMVESKVADVNRRIQRFHLTLPLRQAGYYLKVPPLKWEAENVCVLTIDCNVPVNIQAGLDPIIMGVKAGDPNILITRLQDGQEIPLPPLPPEVSP